jgi:fluoride exporter
VGDPVSVVLVILGAAVGAPLRYLTDRAIRARLASPFPYGTLLVNLGGSAVLGALTGLAASPALTALVGTGFCGALTTYSTFGYEVVSLRPRMSVTYALLSVAGGLGAAAAGYAAGTALHS